MKRPFYPFLLAVYPVLALLGNNTSEVAWKEVWRPLLFTLALGLLLFFVLKLLLRNTARAGLVFAILWGLFFSYGHVYHFLDQKTLLGLSLGHHRLLLPVWGVLLVAGLWWALRRRGELSTLAQAMNTMAIVLLVFPVFQIASAGLRSQSAWANARQQPDSAALHLPASQKPPDIYYIILDAYGREDVLREVIGSDNSAFLAQLESLGF
jgi:hypothetical protein